MLYTNIQKFNDGIRVYGSTPLDDRTVASSVRDLFIDALDKSRCELFGRAYTGMTVTLMDTNEIAILINAEPYTPDSETSIDEDNYLNFWVLTGRQYKITKVNPAPGMYASWKLAYKVLGTPDSSENWVTFGEELEIPLLKIIKDIHYCKGYPDPTDPEHFIETSQPGTPEWETDDNPVYLHIIWNTLDDDGDPTDDSTDQYIKIGDIIKVDLQPIEDEIADLRNYVNVQDASLVNYMNNVAQALEDSVNQTSRELHAYIDAIDTSIYNYVNSMDEKFQRDMRDFRMEIDQTIEDFIQDTSIKTAEMKEYFEQLDASLNAEMNDFREEINNTIEQFVEDSSARDASLREFVSDSVDEIREYVDIVDASLRDVIESTDASLREFVNDTDESLREFVVDSVDEIREYVDDVDSSLRDVIEATDASLREFVNETDESLREFVNETDESLREFVRVTDVSLREFVNDTDASTREFVINTDASLREFVSATDASLREYIDDSIVSLRVRQDEMDQTVAAALELMNVTLQQNLDILADVSVQEQVIAASYVSLDERISTLENIAGSYSASNRSYGNRYGAANLTSYDMSSVFELELGDFISVNFDTDEKLVASVNNQTTDVFSTFSTEGNVVLYYDFLEDGEFKRKFVEIQRTSTTMGKIVSKN